MTVVILFLSALTVVGVVLCVVKGQEARHRLDAILAENELARAERELQEQIDELILDLWVRRAEVEGWIPVRPHDQ